MSRAFLTPIDMAQNELQNVRIQNLAAAPTSPTPVKGQMYFNSTSNTLFWYDGSGWISAVGGAGAFPGYGASTASTTFGASKSDGASTTVARSDHTHGTPTHTGSDHSTIPVSQLAPATADLSWGTNKITNLKNGTSPADAVNKSQLDLVAQGFDPKPSVRVATTANISLSGAGGTVDGVGVADGDRVLVKNQTNPAQNGLYYVSVTAWTRNVELDTWLEAPGALVYVEGGSTQTGTGWVCTAASTGVIDTTAMPWTQAYGPGTILAGAGLFQTGNTIDIVSSGAGISVNADSIGVNFSGSGSAFTVARSDHNHDSAYLRSYAVDVGGATSQVVTHNLNTRDVRVQVYRNTTPWDTVECDVERTTVNTVTLRFAVAPGSAALRATVNA